jgi:hypothetical protein
MPESRDLTVDGINTSTPSSDQTATNSLIHFSPLSTYNLSVKMLAQGIVQLLFLGYASAAIQVKLHNKAGISGTYAVNPDGSCCKYPS